MSGFVYVFDPELLIKGKDQENYGQMELGNLIDHYAGKVTKGDISKRQRLEWKSVDLDNTDRHPQPAEFGELAEDALTENEDNELPEVQEPSCGRIRSNSPLPRWRPSDRGVADCPSCYLARN